MKTQELFRQHDAPASRDAPSTTRLQSLPEKAHKPPTTITLPQFPSMRDWRTRVALSPAEIEAAEDLVRRRYAWRGYRVTPTKNASGAYVAQAPRRVTLLAEHRSELHGTLTVRVDSPQGLLAEQTYGGEIEDLRRQGHRVGELGRLAFEEGAQWKPALDTLVRSAYVVTRLVHGLTDVVIEVNPRHVRFYVRMYGFVTGAPQRTCARVGAPSVLMLLDLEQFGRRMHLSADQAGVSAQ